MIAQVARARNAEPREVRAPGPDVDCCNGLFDSECEPAWSTPKVLQSGGGWIRPPRPGDDDRERPTSSSGSTVVAAFADPEPTTGRSRPSTWPSSEKSGFERAPRLAPATLTCAVAPGGATAVTRAATPAPDHLQSDHPPAHPRPAKKDRVCCRTFGRSAATAGSAMIAQVARARNAEPREARAPGPDVDCCNGLFDSEREPAWSTPKVLQSGGGWIDLRGPAMMTGSARPCLPGPLSSRHSPIPNLRRGHRDQALAFERVVGLRASAEAAHRRR